MSNPDEAEARALATPLGTAFQRLFNDADFAATVIDSPDEIATEYGLDADDLVALLGDAHAMEGEVAGFGRSWFTQAKPLEFTGGLLSPTRLGLSQTRWFVSFSYT